MHHFEKFRKSQKVTLEILFPLPDFNAIPGKFVIQWTSERNSKQSHHPTEGIANKCVNHNYGLSGLELPNAIDVVTQAYINKLHMIFYICRE